MHWGLYQSLHYNSPMSSLNLIHRVRNPAPNASTLAPAIIMVHGWLGDENAMWAFEKALPLNAFVISMRAPVEAEGGYGWMLPGNEERSFEQGLASLHEFVSRLPREYPVNADRVALMGFSQGAAMSCALALSDPHMATAVVALAGFLPDAARQWIAPGRLAGKRVFIAHGIGDTAVPVEDAIRARDALALCGADVTYHEYPVGHKLSAQGMRDLKTWLADFAA
jgi:phospholipase/carboxylesterase